MSRTWRYKGWLIVAWNADRTYWLQSPKGETRTVEGWPAVVEALGIPAGVSPADLRIA